MKSRTKTRSYLGFPLDVVRSPRFANLSGSALKLLVELRLQYNGYNNGDLDCTWSRLKERGWRSQETLSLAIQELLHCGWIDKTRHGKRLCGTHEPNLFAITWEGVDAMPAKGIKGSPVPSHAWKTASQWTRPSRKRKKPTTEIVAANYGNRSSTATDSVDGR